MVKFKKIFIVFCLLVFLFQASPVFALEAEWPALPGTESPQQIQEQVDKGLLDKGQALPLFVKYFLRLFFFIAFILAAATTSIAGVAYLISGARPDALVTAKQWMSRGFLGLAILVLSYLLLAAINPQLLIFKVDIEEIDQSQTEAFDPYKNRVVLMDIDAGETVKIALDTLGAKVPGSAKPVLPTKGMRNIPLPVYLAELPIYEILALLDDAAITTENIIAEFKNCECGLSKFNRQFQGAEKCLGGMSEEEEKEYWQGIEDKINDKGQAGAVEQAKEAIVKIAKGGQAICLTNCENCGTQGCDIAKLKQLRESLKQTLVTLQAKETGLSSEQLVLVENILRGNTTQYMLAQAKAITIGADMTAEGEVYAANNIEVETTRSPIMRGSEDVVMSPSITDPFRFRFPIKGNIFPRETIRYNEKIAAQANNASVFGVLTGLAMEELAKIVEECLALAFGKAQFGVTREFLAEFINKAFQTGAADHLIETLSKESQQQAAQTKDEIEANIKEAANETCLRSCCAEKRPAEECNSYPIDELEQVVWLPDQGRTCDYRCGQTPAHFISRKLAEFFTSPIEEQLPESIQETLNERIRDIILSKPLNKMLDQEIIDLINPVLEGALTESLKELIPGLRGKLESQISQFLPDLMVGTLSVIEMKLSDGLKALREQREQWVNDMVYSLTEAIIEKPLTALIAQAETSKQDCLGLLRHGYVWSETEQETKGCLKMTPGEINAMLSPIDPTFDIDLGWGIVISPEELCQNAQYCWENNQCQECQWINITLDKNTASRLWEEFQLGLVSFGGDLISAVVQTANYTIAKYVNVLVEDEILFPLMPYLNYLEDLQKELNNLLVLAIEDMLPRDLQQLLGKNIDRILKEICAQGKIDIEHDDGSPMLTIEPSAEGRQAACQIEKHLHQTLLDEIGEISESVANVLKAKVRDLLRQGLCPEKSPGQEDQCIVDYLNKSPAEIIWDGYGLTSIKQLIEASPKEFFCGELPLTIQEGKESGKVQLRAVRGGEKNLAQTCQSLQADIAVFSFPFIDSNKEAWNNLRSFQKDFYGKFCPFSYTFCKNPLSSFKNTWGDFIAGSAKTYCDKGGNPEACDALNNSMASSLFHARILIGEELDDWSQEKEIAAYQWLCVLFPDLRDEVKKVFDKRQRQRKIDLLTTWQSILNSVKGYTELDQLPDDIRANAMWIASWFSENKRTDEMLSEIPMGVIKPTKKGEETWLRKKGQNAAENFLSRTPYQLLHNEVCKKIKDDFAISYPDWTLASVRQKTLSQIGPALPYSMESLERPVPFSKHFQIILDTQEVPVEDKTPYLFCLALDRSSSEVLGLSDSLIRYLRPKEYQILFGLINNELRTYERPALLNDLLNYLYNRDPVNLLADAGREVEKTDPEIGIAMQELAGFLDDDIGQHLKRWSPSKTMLNYACLLIDEDCSETISAPDCLCSEFLGTEGWRKIQTFFKKSPLDLIKQYLDIPLIDNENITGVLSIMDGLARNPAIGDPFLDSLGDWTHMTDTTYQWYLAKEKLYASIDSGVDGIKEDIQDASEAAIIGGAKAGYSGLAWAVKGLANLIGFEIGQEVASQVTEIELCRDLPESGTCPDNWIEKTEEDGSKKCCNMALNAVCQDKCREITAKEECKVVEGEVEIEQGDKTFCCYQEKDGKQPCRKCFEKLGPTCTEDEGETEALAADQETKICCHDREIQPDNNQEDCCENVAKCISGKFMPYFKSIIDALTNGVPPVR